MLGPVTVPDHEHGLRYLATFECCSNCRTLFQRPMPTPKQLASFYQDEYHSMRDDGVLIAMRHQMRIRRLKRLLGADAGTVLDYGCGNGSFMRRAAEAIPEAEFVGYEIADQTEVTHPASHVTVVKGALQDLLGVLPPCRVIIMNHVIEHLPDPFAVLSLLAPRLQEGGYFDGQTPNAASLEHRIFGRYWSGFHGPRHTVVFSIRGLRRLLERAGFRVNHIRGAFNPAGYAVSLASLPHGHAPGLIPRHGPKWLLCVAAATVVLPFDVLSGAAGIVDFNAVKEQPD